MTPMTSDCIKQGLLDIDQQWEAYTATDDEQTHYPVYRLIMVKQQRIGKPSREITESGIAESRHRVE